MDNLQGFTSFRKIDEPQIETPVMGTADIDRERAMLLAQAQDKLAQLELAKASKTNDTLQTNSMSTQTQQGIPKQLSAMKDTGTQGTMLSKAGEISQRYGNKSDFYKSGSHFGTDIAVPEGTKVALPAGQWKVVESFTRATASGPNNAQSDANRGYGNSVLVQNIETGEKIRLSHLSQVSENAQLGSILNTGSVIGLSGATGKVAGKTGQHVDIEYYNQLGQLGDLLASPYANQLF